MEEKTSNRDLKEMLGMLVLRVNRVMMEDQAHPEIQAEGDPTAEEDHLGHLEILAHAVEGVSLERVVSLDLEVKREK